MSDAATAVAQGADAIMLSGETAAGAYPVRAVQVLDAIIREAEASEEAAPGPAESDHVAALCDAAVTLASQSSADAIVAVTREGRTARLLSMRRPLRADLCRDRPRGRRTPRLALWWGVRPMVSAIDGDVDTVAARVVDQLVQAGQLRCGATVVVVNASPDLDKAPRTSCACDARSVGAARPLTIGG